MGRAATCFYLALQTESRTKPEPETGGTHTKYENEILVCNICKCKIDLSALGWVPDDPSMASCTN